VASGSGEVVSRIDRKRLDFLTLCAKRLNARSVYFLTVGTCSAAYRVPVGEKRTGLFESGFARQVLSRPLRSW
jgi:hypothetical protein